MDVQKIIKKVEDGDELTVEEIKIYQKVVKPLKQVYGKYGTLKRKYLEYKGIDWTIADLPTYLHNVDRQAEALQKTIRVKLEQDERYKRTGNFMDNYQRQTEIQQLIDEEILNEIVYVV